MTAEIPFPALRRPPLDARGLAATPWSSAEEKARMGDTLLSFIARGMPRQAFSKAVYHRLSNMFGHIAHHNQHGFWETQLSTTAARVSFLEQLVSWPCWGQRTHTWCDVEREITTRIDESGLIAAYRRALRAETEAEERATLARLSAKYAPRPSALPVPGPMQSPAPRQLGLL